jgi:hypothetical protein
MTPEQRFLQFVSFDNGCWLWTGYTVETDGGGKRGRFYYQGKNQWAHRVAYLLFNGPLDDDMLACHSCDVGLCVRPDHIFPGTVQMNNADKQAKGRARGGLVSWILSEAQRADIRARLVAGESTITLAREYNISRQAVSYLKRRITN